MDHDVARLDRLRLAFEDAIDMFGLAGHLPKNTEGR
jgi:hypothetical protein